MEFTPMTWVSELHPYGNIYIEELDDGVFCVQWEHPDDQCSMEITLPVNGVEDYLIEISNFEEDFMPEYYETYEEAKKAAEKIYKRVVELFDIVPTEEYFLSLKKKVI